MIIDQNKQNLIISRIIDFLVLGCTFYVSCLLLSVPLSGDTIFHTLLYAAVILISVRLGRYCLSAVLLSVNSVVKLMLCNATGLLVGSIVMFVLSSSMVPGLNELAIVVVFASVMAFFVLGTISPLLKRNTYISKSGHIAS